MATRRLREPGELEALLEEQIQFIEASSGAFDEGFDSEAKRLAVSIRILVHDTSASKSLLGQLGKKSGQFFDSSIPFEADNKLSHGGLIYLNLSVGDGAKYVAMLDDVPSPMIKWAAFDQWWTMPVLVDKDRRFMSRKDVVLAAANQDGGAHVDPRLDEAYAAISRDNSLGWVSSDGNQSVPMQGAEKATIRQIAHEVLKTLKPGYSKRPKQQTGIMVGGMMVVEGDASEEFNKRLGTRLAVPKVGRNEKCPCNSGQKYKKCHGRL